ncbi:putative signal peptide protein [Puccinia sorghi]|uniref:Putative signal peptide protein n=1 Tax=Puccinia sorghi TaxID=27349 RepID=A0A0L6VMV3_9BASI|nr:putative signal peptide protein [Puccinia sorghi]
MITLRMWIKAFLVSLHQFLNPSPFELSKQSSKRHHSASTGSINPDNHNHRSLTKPTQLSQTMKICYAACISTNLTVQFMILLHFEGQPNIACKPILFSSSSEDEPLPLPLSPKPIFKSAKRTVLIFCLYVFLNDRKETPLPPAGILITAPSTMVNTESQHALHNPNHLSTWLIVKSLSKIVVVELQRISTEIRPNITKDQAELMHNLQPKHNSAMETALVISVLMTTCQIQAPKETNKRKFNLTKEVLVGFLSIMIVSQRNVSYFVILFMIFSSIHFLNHIFSSLYLFYTTRLNTSKMIIGSFTHFPLSLLKKEPKPLLLLPPSSHPSHSVSASTRSILSKQKEGIISIFLFPEKSLIIFNSWNTLWNFHFHFLKTVLFEFITFNLLIYDYFVLRKKMIQGEVSITNCVVLLKWKSQQKSRKIKYRNWEKVPKNRCAFHIE